MSTRPTSNLHEDCINIRTLLDELEAVRDASRVGDEDETAAARPCASETVGRKVLMCCEEITHRSCCVLPLAASSAVTSGPNWMPRRMMRLFSVGKSCDSRSARGFTLRVCAANGQRSWLLGSYLKLLRCAGSVPAAGLSCRGKRSVGAPEWHDHARQQKQGQTTCVVMKSCTHRSSTGP